MKPESKMTCERCAHECCGTDECMKCGDEPMQPGVTVCVVCDGGFAFQEDW
jgi:hypothetical protein